jgi:hypothetical protein
MQSQSQFYMYLFINALIIGKVIKVTHRSLLSKNYMQSQSQFYMYLFINAFVKLRTPYLVVYFITLIQNHLFCVIQIHTGYAYAQTKTRSGGSIMHMPKPLKSY